MAGEGELLLQLHQEMRVISKKETGQPSAGDGRPVAIAGGAEGLNPAALPTNGSADPVAQSSGADGWLIAITAESNQRLTSIQDRRKPRIQKVADLLQKDKKKKALFEPEVVSLGPYHHGRPEFAAMEENKKAAAARFAGGQAVPMHVFYEKVRAVAGAARGCYADEFVDIGDEAFAEMMFFDGCFILHFIDCCCPQDGKSTAPTTKAHLHGFVTRDLFLLENQVPFVVLQALMSLRPVEYERFIRRVTGLTKPSNPGAKKRWWSSGSVTREGGADEGHLHLLDLLRTRLLAGELPQNLRSMEANWQCFRSAMELKEAGITFRKSDTRCLRDVEFRKGSVHGELQLPQIVVDDLTQPRFLNLIALEMCPDSNSDYGVTSYVCFLDRLIDHADDVKELRKKEILLNALGSDQHVADLFNELATGLSPDHFAYSGAVAGIDRHYKNMWKVSVVTMLHAHFSSPWTTISFIAAVFLIILTAVQTIFTVFPKFGVE